MECEQRGLFEHESALLKLLEGVADNHRMEMDFGAAAKRVAAMGLADLKETELPDSKLGTGIDDERGNATFACVLRMCSRQGPTPSLFPWQELQQTAPHALYSKE